MAGAQRPASTGATSRTTRPQRTVRFDLESGGLRLGEQPRGDNGAGQFVARDVDLQGCSATDLQHALRRSSAEGYADDLLISNAPEGYFDEEESLVLPVHFELHERTLALHISFLVEDYDEDAQAQQTAQVLQPLLTRHHMRLLQTWPDENYAAPPWGWHARIGLHTRGWDLAALLQVGQDAIALLDAMSSGQLTRQTAGDLLRAAQARVLIGQPEGHWLDVKAQQYPLNTPKGQISLAQAVSRFCNAESGGLVVFGMGTKKIRGGEEIRKLCPMPWEAGIATRYQQVLDRRVFPPLDSMTVEAVKMDDEMIIVIDVPPQPEELKPFLVHGAIVDGDVEGAFISIVRRRGEASIPTTAPMIHSMLAAGRALLRRGELP